MASFSYRAVDGEGRLRRGRLEAADVADLERRLLAQGLELVSCRARRFGWPVRGNDRVRRSELIHFCFLMEQFGRAGISLLAGLAELRDGMGRPALRQSAAALHAGVEAGSSLSDAMAAQPRVYDALFVGMVRAGETSGRMPEVFASLHEMLTWQEETAARARKALLLPCLVAMVILGATLFLLIYLVPRLVHFLAEMGQSLPWHTRALIALSDFCLGNWPFLVAIPLFPGLAALCLARCSEKVRCFFDGLSLRVPLFGPLRSKLLLSRLSRTFALLYAAGIPVLQGLEVCAGLLGNRVLAAGCRQAVEEIGQGREVSSAFAASGLFPSLLVRMLAMGEATGGLDRTLTNLSKVYEREVRESLDRLQAVAEPAMTIVLGLLLGWVMLAVLGPIYDTIGRVSF